MERKNTLYDRYMKSCGVFFHAERHRKTPTVFIFILQGDGRCFNLVEPQRICTNSVAHSLIVVYINFLEKY